MSRRRTVNLSGDLKRSSVQTTASPALTLPPSWQRGQKNIFHDIYLIKWISWASRSRMPDIVNLKKTINRYLDGILGRLDPQLTLLMLKASTTRSAQHSSDHIDSSLKNTKARSYI